MTGRQVMIKAELLADIEPAWAALNAALDRLTPTQMTTIKDGQGWTVKDHLIHLTAWERSIVFFLTAHHFTEHLAWIEALVNEGPL
jgi:hypothetical protein